MLSAVTLRVPAPDAAAVLARLQEQTVPANSFDRKGRHRYRLRRTTPTGLLLALPGKDPLVLHVTAEPLAPGCRVVIEMSRSWLVLALLCCFTGVLAAWFASIAMLRLAPLALLGVLPLVATGIAMLRFPARFRRECRQETEFLRAWLGADP